MSGEPIGAQLTGAWRRAGELLAALVILLLTAAFARTVLQPPAAAQPDPPQATVDPAQLRAAGTANPCVRGELALTFDDGPDVYTRAILDVLRAYGVQATFFVLGAKATARPDLIRAEVADGHRVENHSWNHPHLSDLTAEQIRAQLTDTQHAIVAAGAPAPAMLRPPFGDTSPMVDREAAALGLHIVRWSVDTNDWRGRASNDIETAVLAQLAPGAVILLHDGTRESGNTLRALPKTIQGLRAQGFCTAAMRVST